MLSRSSGRPRCPILLAPRPFESTTFRTNWRRWRPRPLPGSTGARIRRAPDSADGRGRRGPGESPHSGGCPPPPVPMCLGARWVLPRNWPIPRPPSRFRESGECPISGEHPVPTKRGEDGIGGSPFPLRPEGRKTAVRGRWTSPAVAGIPTNRKSMPRPVPHGPRRNGCGGRPTAG